MQSTVSKTTARDAEEAFAQVELPKFARARNTQFDDKHMRAKATLHAADSGEAPMPGHKEQVFRPRLIPDPVPIRRQAPKVVSINRSLRTVLIALCGMAILGYGLDVAASNEVGRLQEQARRINEQNSELSAQLLRAISFQGIQDSVLGHFGLHIPEQVVIVKEVHAPALKDFKPSKHQLPIMSGY